MRKLLMVSTALATALAAFIPPASADTAYAPETVVVTATRTEQPLEVTGTSMSVITANEIEDQQTVFVTDLLAETPGLIVVRNGGVGQTTTISIRGSEAGQTLVLVDGVRLNDPSSPDDQAILGDVLSNNIDRIEVLRGPQSTLYGSDAIGGVVNILTKRGGPSQATASAEGGSFDTWRLNAGVSGTADRLEYGAAVNYLDTGGISAADEKNGNPEADAYRNLGATLNTRFNVDANLSFDLRGYYTQSHIEIDGFPPPDFAFTDDAEFGTDSLVSGYAGANLSLAGGHFRNRLAFIASESNRKFFGVFDFFTNAYSPDENFFARGDAQRFEYQGTYDFDDANQLTFGAETQRVSLSTQSLQFDPGPTTGSRRTNSFYVQEQSTLFDQLTLTGGLRVDDDDEFGTHTSLKFAGAWNIPGWDTVLRANYGDGFKAPTLYELFSQYKNPFHDLKPETANGWEVGADHDFGVARVSLTYFERHTHNQIDFFSTFTPPFGYYENLDRTRATGIEAEVETRINDVLSVTANYTNLDAKDVLTGLDLARRPADSAGGTLTWTPTAEITLGTSVTYVGERFDDRANLRRLPSNTTVNLFGSYKVYGNTELFARAENLFDEDSEPVATYGRMGFAAYGGIRTTF